MRDEGCCFSECRGPGPRRVRSHDRPPPRKAARPERPRVHEFRTPGPPNRRNRPFYAHPLHQCRRFLRQCRRSVVHGLLRRRRTFRRGRRTDAQLRTPYHGRPEGSVRDARLHRRAHACEPRGVEPHGGVSDASRRPHDRRARRSASRDEGRANGRRLDRRGRIRREPP